LHHDDILKFRNDICKSEVKKGMTEAPFYYILPLKQHDQSELVGLVHLLKEQGINVYQLQTDVSIENKNYKKGAVVVPLAHAFRPFIKEVMESQEFPVRHYTPDGEVISPYDITTWSLPLHRGLESFEVNTSYEELSGKLSEIGFDYNLNPDTPKSYKSVLLNVNNNESYMLAFKAMAEGFKVLRLDADMDFNGLNYPKGSFIIDASKKKSWLEAELKDLKVEPAFIESGTSMKETEIENHRIALIETYMHDMDAGWTRFVFDSYGIQYTVVHPGDFENINFADDFDIVVFPNNRKSTLMDGKNSYGGEVYVANYPPEFTKGIGKKGMAQIMKFIVGGGTIVSWGESISLFEGMLTIKDDKGNEENFNLPFSNIGPQLSRQGLYCPGSLVKINLIEDHPLTLGMPAELGVFSRGTPAFATSIPMFDMDRRVIAKLPEKDILMSGYIEKEELLSNKSVMIWMKKGKGQFVLFGFNPQFRASTQAAYKLLFNSLLLPKL